MKQGFSLAEVLVALLLLTSTMLLLLKQQWNVCQLFNQIHSQSSALNQLENAQERLYVSSSGLLFTHE